MNQRTAVPVPFYALRTARGILTPVDESPQRPATPFGRYGRGAGAGAGAGGVGWQPLL
jgi:hypothetical protein